MTDTFNRLHLHSTAALRKFKPKKLRKMKKAENWTEDDILVNSFFIDDEE